MRTPRGTLAVRLAVGTLLVAASPARSGEILTVTDPRAFEQPTFPNAQVKIVTFEFTSVGTDERGKERAKELHRELLDRIHDISSGAVVTFVTPPHRTIDSFKLDVEKVARAQDAQMALWGRVLVDSAGKSLVNARLALVVPPRGIEASYGKQVQPRPGIPPLQLRGSIRGPVAKGVLEFSSLESDVTPLATFVSGLMRYYRADQEKLARKAAPWLVRSAAELERYARETPEAGNASNLAAALLFAARAHVRLADAQPKQAAAQLAAAWANLERAGGLDPYDPAIPTAKAIVTILRGGSAEAVRPHLASAASLAPADSDARLNLALVESATGDISGAVKQAENSQFVHKAQRGTEYEPAAAVKKDLSHYQVEFNIK